MHPSYQWYLILLLISFYEPLIRSPKHITEFLYHIACEEKDENKHTKLQKLALTDAEWKHVGEFTRLLEVLVYITSLVSVTHPIQFTDKAQQAFSSDNQPSLHYALPVLESLHKAWSS